MYCIGIDFNRIQIVVMVSNQVPTCLVKVPHKDQSLPPMLLTIYINNMYLSHCYANDTIFFVSDTANQACSRLQSASGDL